MPDQPTDLAAALKASIPPVGPTDGPVPGTAEELRDAVRDEVTDAVATPAPPPYIDPHVTSPDDAFVILAPGVSMEMAKVATLHAIYVQGGHSTVQREAERLAADLADGGTLRPADEVRMEVMGALVDTPDSPVVDAEGDAVPSGELDMSLVRRFREVYDRHAAAQAEADALKKERDELDKQMVEMYRDAGVPSMSVDGKTLYLNRKTFAQRKDGVTTDDVKDALRLAGFPEMITETINANTLSSFVREYFDPENPKPFPQPLAEVLELGERITIGVTAAGRKGRTRTT